MSKLDCINALEDLLRDVSAAVRKKHQPNLERVVVQMGQRWEDYKYLALPLPRWPSRLNSAKSYRFVADFNHGEAPDPQRYVANAEEICLLLKYTPASLKVAMSTGRGQINRVQRGSRLGPCIVHRLEENVDLEANPRLLFLGDREARVLQSGYKRFRGPTKPGMFKKRYD